MDVFSLVATLELNASNFFSGLAGAAKAMIDFAADAVKTGAEFDYAMANVRAVTGEFKGDLNGLISDAGKLGLAFERGADDTETAFNIIREKALQSSAQTRYTAEETAEALKYMGMAGWDVTEMFAGLDAVMDAAAASGMDVGRASDIITDALTAFHKPAEEAEHLVDVLATAAAKSNTNISMLGESFKYVSPLAGELGYSFEDVALALGLMANSGIKSGMAGRAMRNFLTNLASLPTDKIREAAVDLGVSLSDAEGGMYSLRQIMEMFRDSGSVLESGATSSPKLGDWIGDNLRTLYKQTQSEYAAITDVITQLKDGATDWKDAYYALDEIMGDTFSIERQQKFFSAASVFTQSGLENLIDLTYKLGGKQALPGLLSIVSASEEDFNALADALDNSAGAGERMRETMLENLTGDLYRFNSAADVMRVAISDKLTPTVREFVQFGTQGINDITEAFETGGVQALPAAVERFMSGARDLIEQHAPEIEAAGQSIATALAAGVEIAWPYVKQIVGGLWDIVKPDFLQGASDLISGIPDMLFNAFSEPLHGLAEAARGNMFFGWLSGFLDDLAGGKYNASHAGIINALGETKTTSSYGGGDFAAIAGNGSNVGSVIGSDAVEAYAAATEAAETYNETAAEVPEEITTIVNADTSGAIANINALNNAYSSLPTSINIDIGGAGRVVENSRSEHMNASSMSGGTILRGATMFGWDREGIPQIGGGEGAEAVVGVNSLHQMIHESVTGAVSSLMNGLGGMIAGGQRQPAQLVLDTGVLVAAIAPSMNDEMSRIDTWRHGGDR